MSEQLEKQVSQPEHLLEVRDLKQYFPIHTGWFQNTEMGFELGADDWHIWCTWALQGMIALHLLAILFTSWRQRSNLVKRMLPRRRDKARALPQESDA